MKNATIYIGKNDHAIYLEYILDSFRVGEEKLPDLEIFYIEVIGRTNARTINPKKLSDKHLELITEAVIDYENAGLRAYC